MYYTVTHKWISDYQLVIQDLSNEIEKNKSLRAADFGESPLLLIEKLYLVEALGFAHGALDVEGTHVLPVLLQQRHQEVDSQVDVVHKLVFCHLHMSYGHSQTQHLQRAARLRHTDQLLQTKC